MNEVKLTGFNNSECFSTKDDYTITYKAVSRDSRGLILAEPIIMLAISDSTNQGPWIDAERVSVIVKEEKQRLIDKMDTDFIPN